MLETQQTTRFVVGSSFLQRYYNITINYNRIIIQRFGKQRLTTLLLPAKG
jgi:hypothetical protein